MLYFGHPSCLEHDPQEGLPGHPERPDRLRAIEAGLEERDWLGWDRREAPAASEAELLLVHPREHLERIRGICEAGGGAIDPDTYAGQASYQAALRSAGAACEMTRALLSGEAEVGFAAGRPPGHHAERSRAMGFCLFDNVAVAAALAVAELGIERVLVLDWDVHHGNGTAEIFRHRDDVLFASIHQGGIFPGSGAREDVGSGPGEGYTINLPVPAASEEGLWLSLLGEEILPAASRFEPQLVLISAGFDGHREDPLAECRLETASFGRMAALVRAAAREWGAPVGAVLEGGYALPALAESVAATMAALGGDGARAESSSAGRTAVGDEGEGELHPHAAAALEDSPRLRFRHHPQHHLACRLDLTLLRHCPVEGHHPGAGHLDDEDRGAPSAVEPGLAELERVVGQDGAIAGGRVRRCIGGARVIAFTRSRRRWWRRRGWWWRRRWWRLEDGLDLHDVATPGEASPGHRQGPAAAPGKRRVAGVAP
jgi:acetoin utilization deacetylase AcuC-like enzyme